MVPGFQPLFGAMGKGLEILTKIDSQSGWDTAGQFSELAITTATSGLGQVSSALGSTLEMVKEAKEDTEDKDKPKSEGVSDELVADPPVKSVTLALMAAQMVVGQVKGEAEHLAPPKLSCPNILQYFRLIKKIVKWNYYKFNSSRNRVILRLPLFIAVKDYKNSFSAGKIIIEQYIS